MHLNVEYSTGATEEASVLSEGTSLNYCRESLKGQDYQDLIVTVRGEKMMELGAQGTGQYLQTFPQVICWQKSFEKM